MTAALRYTGSHGIILFLFLIAFAMVQMSSVYTLLPLIFLAVLLYTLPLLTYATSYLCVALTVCKIE